MQTANVVTGCVIVGLIVLVVLIATLVKVPTRRCGYTLEHAKTPGAPAPRSWGMECDNAALKVHTFKRPLWRILFPVGLAWRNVCLLAIVILTISFTMHSLLRRKWVNVSDYQEFKQTDESHSDAQAGARRGS